MKGKKAHTHTAKMHGNGTKETTETSNDFRNQPCLQYERKYGKRMTICVVAFLTISLTYTPCAAFNVY